MSTIWTGCVQAQHFYCMPTVTLCEGLIFSGQNIMPSSHHRLSENKTALSCPCWQCEQKSRLSAIENFETVFSSLNIRRELQKTVLTCRQFVHTTDKTRQSCLVRIGVRLFFCSIKIRSFDFLTSLT